jgi:hypothetical protein
MSVDTVALTQHSLSNVNGDKRANTEPRETQSVGENMNWGQVEGK